jgi:hypothetical protein
VTCPIACSCGTTCREQRSDLDARGFHPIAWLSRVPNVSTAGSIDVRRVTARSSRDAWGLPAGRPYILWGVLGAVSRQSPSEAG